ncbi:T9SS type A sorting domain-containing protein [Aureispira anguillae]|uniref:T9SS type A sorting domain-containing protein n=1 Tax=Aureispira anguillae TaxID=2864201 RepID=A0A915YDR0_9BACT|nr:T9SS type A sorting domain-containing protein [Aureispira anguillae]BDS11182.1 T9SS type A sorting domain-containing protein [Aureispira anguillae]
MPKIYTLVLLFLSIYQLNAQGSLKWVVEGSLHSSSSTGGITYSFQETSINNVNYTEGTDPFLWGYLITTTSAGVSDTVDFEVLVESSSISGTGNQQLTIYDSDSTMDLQTHFNSTPLNQFIRLQFNIFKYGTRTNLDYSPGSGGIPRKASIGFSAPNSNITGVGRLHAAEVYYIEDLLSTNPVPCEVVDNCDQIDTVILGQNHSDFVIGAEDINQSSLTTAKSNMTYPYDINGGRTYIHAMEAQNTCDNNNNNQLQVDEASYNVYFPPMSSFIVGRQDIAKSSANTGIKSAMGFSLSSSFNPSVFPIELNHWQAKVVRNNNVQLNWVTASEINNALFEIEHALPTSGVPNFQVIGTIEGAGTTNLAQYYDYKVSNLTNGVHYFRLKQIDFDGTTTYSPIKAATIKGIEQTMSVYPTSLTSSTSSLFVKVNLEGSHQVRIYNLMGAVIESFTSNFSAKQYNELKIDAAKYETGIYFIQVANEGEGFVQKIRIE